MIIEKNFNWEVNLSLGNDMNLMRVTLIIKEEKNLLSEFLKEFFLHFNLEYALSYVYSFLEFLGQNH